MDSSQKKFTNNLIDETSPYLLQHAHNPVNWYPWENEALVKAKKENKLIIVSIGYSACHWCHVMEVESFENEKIAKFMNENFVSIKVDREERPDIDQVYMNAVQLLTGRGGWPLNCIALPDGRPIYGGTYFSAAQWIEMLSNILDFVKNKPDKTEEQAENLTRHIQASEIVFENSSNQEFSSKDLDFLFEKWEKSIDFEEGGSIGAPKFPLPAAYKFLLHYNHISQNENALKAVVVTLDKMANGGIYDQIGGGFSRYSVDSHWKVPHFEKMLYDNAQLISLYSLAYQKTKKQKYKIVVMETIDFIKRELTSPEGGFYSSLDADSEGVEGKSYLWTKNELQNILNDDSPLIVDYYNVTDAGNWKNGKNILLKSENKNLIEKYNISEQKLDKQISRAKQILLKARNKRVQPGLDDKILLGWNALMNKAYTEAYKAFGEIEYLNSAIENMDFIYSKMSSEDNRLNRNYKNSKASINGFLDDYAFTIEALISLYEVTFDEKWINRALELTTYSISHFFNEENNMFYYTSDIDPPLIARKFVISDNVIPSSNSQMAKNLFVLGNYFNNDEFIEKSKSMLNNVKQNSLTGEAYFANWDILHAWFVDKPYEVTIAGEDFETLRMEFQTNYLPNIFFSGGNKKQTLSNPENKLIENQTTIYVCRDKVCKLPVTTVNDALEQIS
jgi:uncharacterized protein